MAQKGQDQPWEGTTREHKEEVGYAWKQNKVETGDNVERWGGSEADSLDGKVEGGPFWGKSKFILAGLMLNVVNV